MKSIRHLAGVLAALAMGGCAVGNQHNYTIQTPDLPPQGTRSVAIATQDLRPYVVTKEKAPNFVGVSRGGFGNPFDITTQSNQPLANDFSATIARALQQRGFKTTVLDVAVASRPAPQALAEQGKSERLAVVSIHEWKSDTFMNTALIYELTLGVYDSRGEQLANNRIVGRDNLGGDAINPPSHAKGAVPEAFKKKLEELFRNDAVIGSLR
jgi:hypothetical protein